MVKITKIYRSNKDKNGNLLTTKDGREYTRLAFKCVEHGDKWVSGFGNDANASWAVGDDVDVVIEESGQYVNFKMPSNKVSPEDVKNIWEEIEKLKQEIEKLKNASGIIGDNPPF